MPSFPSFVFAARVYVNVCIQLMVHGLIYKIISTMEQLWNNWFQEYGSSMVPLWFLFQGLVGHRFCSSGLDLTEAGSGVGTMALRCHASWDKILHR